MADGIALPKLECKACGHHWTPRQSVTPGTCPKCRSATWQEGRRRAPRRIQVERANARRAAIEAAIAGRSATTRPGAASEGA